MKLILKDIQKDKNMLLLTTTTDKIYRYDCTNRQFLGLRGRAIQIIEMSKDFYKRKFNLKFTRS